MKDKKLKRLEDDTYLHYHQDGLIDITIGFVITLFAVGMEFNANLSGLFAPAAFFIYMAIKHKITIPRIGKVKLQSDHKTHKQSMIVLITGTLLFCFFVFSYIFFRKSLTPASLNAFPTFPVGVIFGLGLFIIAIMTKVYRFIFYAILIMASVFIGPMINIHDGYHIGFVGTFLVMSGTMMLIMFVRKYPAQKE